jgi:GntR family transcriptional regulator
VKQPALYLQIADAFLRDIAAGRLRAGDKIPIEDEIMRQYRVSRITVRQALDVLRQRGLLERFPRRGSFVTSPSSMSVWTIASISDVIDAGWEVEKKVIDWRAFRVPGKPGWLPWSPGERLYRLRSVRSQDGMPLYYIEVYVPALFGKQLSLDDLERVTVTELLNHKLGIPIAGGEEEIFATVASGTLARRLGVRPGSPLLVLDMVFHAADGKPLEAARAWYRADKFKRKNRLRGAALFADRRGNPATG